MLEDESRAARMWKCTGSMGSRNSGGTSIFTPASRLVVPQAKIPFGVTVQASGMTYRASVYWDSSLLKNIVLNNTQTIAGQLGPPVWAGLANAPAPTGDGNPNWFTFDYGNDLIWLEILLDGAGNPTSAGINSWGLGGTWAPGDLPGEYVSGHGPFEYQLTYDSSTPPNKIYTQYIARIAIFASITSTSAPYPVTNLQLLNSNLIMRGDIYDGALYTTGDGPAIIPIVMPMPYSGPYITL
jgi:hypothetical protein